MKQIIALAALAAALLVTFGALHRATRRPPTRVVRMTEPMVITVEHPEP